MRRLLGIVVLATAVPAHPAVKPCPRLCAAETSACVASCRVEVSTCRDQCAGPAREPARRCRRRCARPCHAECRRPLLRACRIDADRTRCHPSAAVTTTSSSSSSTTTTPTTSTSVSTTSSTSLPAKADWATFGFDLQRTGDNPRETTLGTDTVGRLAPAWATDVGAVVAASPVLATSVATGDDRRDLLFVGTEHGEMYALDAASGAVVWHRNLGSQSTTCGDMPDGVFGITDTPAVDRATGSLFVAGGDGNLYSLDLATGTTHAGWPVSITADPAHEHVWSAITLAGGALYVATASYCDESPYRGRLVRVDPATAAVDGTWYVTSAANAPAAGGGIWGAGGVSTDASGGLYVATGNATGLPENSGYAEHVVRLSSALAVEASNAPDLVGYDVDFGSTPVPYQAPGCPPQLVVENKSGDVLVYDRDSIDTGPAQQLAIAGYVDGGELIGVPAVDVARFVVYVASPTDASGGPYRHGILAFGVGADCRLTLAWQQSVGVNGAVVSSPTVANGVVYYGDGPGNEVLALSAASGDVVWRSGDAIQGPIFAPPIVVNGRLYVASWDGMVRAFALL